MSFITRRQWAQFVKDDSGNPDWRTIQDLEQLDTTSNEALDLLTPQLAVNRGGTGVQTFPVGGLLIGNGNGSLLTFSTTANRSVWGAGLAGIDDDPGFTRTGDSGRYLFGAADNTSDKVQVNGGLLAGGITLRASIVNDQTPGTGLTFAALAATALNTNGGAVTLASGAGLGTGNGGAFGITSGNGGATGNGGALSLFSGSGVNGGDIAVRSGTGTTSGGDATLAAAAASGAAGVAGINYVYGGDSQGVGGIAGHVYLAPGRDTGGGGTAGKIFFTESSLTLATSFFDPALDLLRVGTVRPTANYQAVDGTAGVTFGAAAIATLTVKNGLVVAHT